MKGKLQAKAKLLVWYLLRKIVNVPNPAYSYAWGYDILKIVSPDLLLCSKLINLNLINFYSIDKHSMFLKFGFSEINRLSVDKSIYSTCHRKKMHNVSLKP